MSFSHLDTGERLAELRQHYVERLEETHRVLEAYLEHCRSGSPKRSERDDLQPAARSLLHRMAHRLAGSAGSYGFSQLGEAAREVELCTDASSAEADDDGALETALRGLIGQIRNLDASAVDKAKDVDGAAKAAAVAGRTNPKVFVVDDDPLIGALLVRLLQGEIEVRVILDGVNVVALVERERPDLILLDDDLPGLAGQDVVKGLRAREDLRDIPIVMLTANKDPRNVMRATEAGAIDYFTKPFEPISFVQHVHALLARNNRTVLIVDDDASIRDLLRYRFEALGIRVTQAEDGAAGLAMLRKTWPNLVILDRMMPGLEGGAVLHELRKAPRGRDIPVIMLTARSGQYDAVDWLRRGAVDFIAKPFSPDEVVLRSLRAMGLEDAT